jgi:RNA polymerase sigma-70 factor (ECF subfamily)
MALDRTSFGVRGSQGRRGAAASDASGRAATAPRDGTDVRVSEMLRPVDLELVARARAGDADAFEELVRLHTPQLYRLLTRMLGNATAAEDVAQESFVRAWRALPNFRAEAKFSTWLYRIAVNEANRFLARESRRELLPFDDVLLEVPDLGAQTAELAEAGELRSQLERLLAELPAHYRGAVVLRDVEGFSNEEAAELLELDLRNFKSRLHRGRMALRRLLEELAESE